MKPLKALALFICLFVVLPAAARADAREKERKSTVRLGTLVGTGGTVGNKGSVAGGLEYELFRDDYNHTLSLSVDMLVDRTAAGVDRPLLPVLANTHWYSGKDPSSGFYVSAGLGLAIPFWDFHGGGAFAWQGSMGYAFSRGLFEIRYLGRRGQQVIHDGVPFRLNNSFVGGMFGFRF